MKNLVIVESPAKAKTLSRFLGGDYRVEASYGHLIDLPKSKIGVDVDGDFSPQYQIMADKAKRAQELSELAKESENLFLATDPDREGEAISWHLLNLFAVITKHQADVPLQTKAASKITLPYERVVFHEITEPAVKAAFDNPRKIDDNLVNAQQARRVLDRVVGYKLSPLLWRKVRIGLSAGRVQSVALRLIVDREREIAAFVPVEYWSIAVELAKQLKKGEKHIELFLANLIERDGKKIEIGTKEESDTILNDLAGRTYQIADVRKKETRRSPYPPFTTATMQQGAANRFGFTAKKTMKLAQDLYEQGYITYMRTDSMHLAESAVTSAREFIAKNYGKQFVPEKPRMYATKSKVAQEAHEAIRPTNVNAKLEEIKALGKDHLRLYDLIWKRTVASQMADAVYDQTTVDVNALDSKQANAPVYMFRSNGSQIKFAGWLLAFAVGKKNVKDAVEEIDEEDLPYEDRILPELAKDEVVDFQRIIPEQHFTQPPPRFTEAGLIKALEGNDIGRPSTYAPIISTILERRYVEKVEKKFVPTAVGFAVSDFLVGNFPDIMDVAFTAKMEGTLDEVANGERDWISMMRDFYTPFDKKVEQVGEKSERVKIDAPESDEHCPKCDKVLLIRTGRFGRFYGCSGFPACDYKASFSEKIDMKCPTCTDGDVIIKYTKRRRPFYGCSNYPKCDYASWNDPMKPAEAASAVQPGHA